MLQPLPVQNYSSQGYQQWVHKALISRAVWQNNCQLTERRWIWNYQSLQWTKCRLLSVSDVVSSDVTGRHGRNESSLLASMHCSSSMNVCSLWWKETLWVVVLSRAVPNILFVFYSVRIVGQIVYFVFVFGRIVMQKIHRTWIIVAVLAPSCTKHRKQTLPKARHSKQLLFVCLSTWEQPTVIK